MRSSLLLLLATSAPVHAGWVTIKNDTTQAIIVQETCTVNNKVRLGKPVKLMPGETLREFQNAPGTKTMQLFEPGLLMNKSLGKTELTWKDDDRAFSIKKEANEVKLQPATATKSAVVQVGK